MDKPTKQQKLELVIADLDKKYEQGTVIRVGNEHIPTIPFVPTGAMTLDRAIGLGGFPMGRIIELFGAESSGKTTLALSIVAQAQAEGKTCLYIDAEQALDPVYALSIGINMDDLLLAQPEYGEKAFDIMERMIRSQEVDVIVVDSVAALMPRAEMEADMESQQMGALGRLMSKGLRKINGLLTTQNSQTMVIFINQLREKIGVMFGNPETTPGGRALKFYSSLRIDLRKVEALKDSQGEFIGNKVRANIIKNKVGPPLRKGEFDIIYGRGVDAEGCVFDLAVEAGVIKKSGTWYSYNDEQLGQGRSKVVEKLREDAVLLSEVKELLK